MLERIDELLAAAEEVITAAAQARAGFGLVMAAGVIAATEPLSTLGS